jgi:2-amino-4-hydroxy-6-hydroxymethyldihydropteridine diphosphokinase
VLVSESSPQSTPAALVPVGIALGSNIGNRAAELEAGFAFLQTLATEPIRRSSIIETAPVDCPPDSSAFLNAVAEIVIDSARLAPRDLLAQLQDFERQRGRTPGHPRNSPRPLDLDLLYYGGVVLKEPDLVVPHPRLATRDFVLKPLAELQPNLVLPGQTRTVRELLAAGAGR